MISRDELIIRNRNLPANKLIINVAGHSYELTLDNDHTRYKQDIIDAINAGIVYTIQDLMYLGVTDMKEVHPMRRYFLITGLDDGNPIEPYMVETNGELPYVIQNPPYGDHARYCQDIGRTEVIDNMKKGMVLE